MHSNYLQWGLRLILGILITGAGVGKLLDVAGFVNVIGTYQLGFPVWEMWLIAIAIIVFELTLGIVILLGYRLKTAALWSIAMHTGYFILLTTALFRGLQLQNCGCFGVFLARSLMWYSPLEDLALIGISYGLFRLTNQNIKSHS
jgi:uncharacterized membrane protein YphA (DoxX/SURF4 family)